MPYLCGIVSITPPSPAVSRNPPALDRRYPPQPTPQPTPAATPFHRNQHGHPRATAPRKKPNSHAICNNRAKPPKQNCCDLRTTPSTAAAVCARLETNRETVLLGTPSAPYSQPHTASCSALGRRSTPSRSSAPTRPKSKATQPLEPFSHRSPNRTDRPRREPRAHPSGRRGQGTEDHLRGLLLPPEPSVLARRAKAVPDVPRRGRRAEGTAATQLRFPPGAHALCVGLCSAALSDRRNSQSTLRHFPSHEGTATLLTCA